VLLLLVLAILLATGSSRSCPTPQERHCAGAECAGIYLVIVSLLVAFGFVASQAIGEQASSLTSDLPNLSRRLGDLAAGLPPGRFAILGPRRRRAATRAGRVATLLRVHDRRAVATGLRHRDRFRDDLRLFTVFVIALLLAFRELMIRRLVLRSVARSIARES